MAELSTSYEFLNGVFAISGYFNDYDVSFEDDIVEYEVRLSILDENGAVVGEATATVDDGFDFLIKVDVETDRYDLTEERHTFRLEGREIGGMNRTGELSEKVILFDGAGSVPATKRADIIVGGLGDDRVEGLAGADYLYGGGGKDTLIGGAGRDTLEGGGGDDVSYGGAGADRLFDSRGDDSLIGGDGGDYYTVDRDGRAVIIEEADGTGVDRVSTDKNFYVLPDNVENLTLWSRYGDGNDLDNIIDIFSFRFSNVDGLGGDDLIRGGFQTRDRLSGDDGADTLSGGSLDDTLLGGSGRDHLLGGTGSDYLEGGLGADRLEGGDGADLFKFYDVRESAPKKMDVITDFSRAEKDQIDVYTIDADARDDEFQRFVFIEDQKFSGAAGELRYRLVKDGAVVEADVDGNKRADFAVKLLGVSDLVVDDFMLL